MTRWILREDGILGAVFCSAASLLMLGGLRFPFGTEIVAFGLAALGVVMLVTDRWAPTWLAATCLAAGTVMLVSNPLGMWLHHVVGDLLQVAAALTFLALGVFKLAGTGPRRAKVRTAAVPQRSPPNL